MTSIKVPADSFPQRVPYTVEQRQAVERKIVVQAVNDLLKAGFYLEVNDGDEDVTEKTMDQAVILDAMFSTDEDIIFVYWPGRLLNAGWIRFIYGNDGPDVINDYTVNLEEHLADTLALAEAEEEKLHG